MNDTQQMVRLLLRTRVTPAQAAIAEDRLLRAVLIFPPWQYFCGFFGKHRMRWVMETREVPHAAPETRSLGTCEQCGLRVAFYTQDGKEPQHKIGQKIEPW